MKISQCAFFVLALLVFASLTAVAEEGIGILAQITDPQLGFNDFESERNRFHNTVNIVNDQNFQCAVICGDLVHNCYNKEHLEAFKQELSRLKKPYFLVRGNHDDEKLFRENFGPTYYAADLPFKGFRLIVLDTNLWTPKVLPEAEKMEAMLLEELQKAKAAGQKVIIAGHCPIFEKHFNEEKWHNNFTMEKREWMAKLFDEFPVVAYFSGHSHTTFTWLWHGVLLSNSETTSVAFDKINYGFRKFIFEDGAIQFFTALVPTTK